MCLSGDCYTTGCRNMHLHNTGGAATGSAGKTNPIDCGSTAPAPTPHTPSPEGVKSCGHTTWSVYAHTRLRHAVCPGGKGVASRGWQCMRAVTRPLPR